MIYLFDKWADDLSTTGICLLHPSKCVVKEEGGGMYDLDMTVPMGSRTHWEQIELGCLLRVPVPSLDIGSVLAKVNGYHYFWQNISGANQPVYASTETTRKDGQGSYEDW